jgi:hypothetical protein
MQWIQNVIHTLVDWKYSHNYHVDDFTEEMSRLVSYCVNTRENATDELTYIQEQCIE